MQCFCGRIVLDAEIKQELSSVRFVKTVCENSIERLNKTHDVTDSMVSTLFTYFFLTDVIILFIYVT